MHYRRPNAGVSVTTRSPLFGNRYEVEALNYNVLLNDNVLKYKTSFTRSESLPSSVQDI